MWLYFLLNKKVVILIFIWGCQCAEISVSQKSIMFVFMLGPLKIWTLCCTLSHTQLLYFFLNKCQSFLLFLKPEVCPLLFSNLDSPQHLDHHYYMVTQTRLSLITTFSSSSSFLLTSRSSSVSSLLRPSRDEVNHEVIPDILQKSPWHLVPHCISLTTHVRGIEVPQEKSGCCPETRWSVTAPHVVLSLCTLLQPWSSHSQAPIAHPMRSPTHPSCFLR